MMTQHTQTQVVKHTPGPLHVHPGVGNRLAEIHAEYDIDDRPQHHIVFEARKPDPNYGNIGSQNANAARLALCWNTFDERAEALQQLQTRLIGHVDTIGSYKNLRAMKQIVDTVLAHATPAEDGQ